jgi:dCTP diphosphatase
LEPDMSHQKLDQLLALRVRLREFAAERDWDQFHSPKNLVMALSAEAGELVEVFQWSSEIESANPNQVTRDAAAKEMADVLIYLVRLADKLDVNLLEAADRKIEQNALKYPASEVRGSARKR